MRSVPYSNIEWLILAWVIANLNLFVIGYPMIASKGVQSFEDAKNVGTAGHAGKISTGSKNVNVAPDTLLLKPDDFRTSVVSGPSKTGSGTVEIADSMRQGRVEVSHIPNTLQTGSKDLQVAHDFSYTKPDGVQTSTFFCRPQIFSWFLDLQTGSWFSKIKGFIGSFRGADISLPKVPNASVKLQETRGLTVNEMTKDLLRFTPTARAQNAAPLVPEVNQAFKNQNAMVFKGQMEDIKPAEVEKLSPDRLIGYAADRNDNVEGMARNLYKASEEYTKAEQKAFEKASVGYSMDIKPWLIMNKKNSARSSADAQKMIEDIVEQKMKDSNVKGIYKNDMTMSIREAFIDKIAVLYPEVEKRLQDLRKAREIYQQSWTDTYKAAHQLSKVKSLEPQELARLTNKEYVEKAAFYDINIYQKYAQWSEAEKRLGVILNEPDLVKALETKFETATQDKETKILLDKWKEDSKAKGKPIDEETANARSRFIKEQASLDPGLKQYMSRIKSAEKQLETTKNTALRGADKYYKSHKLLKSAGNNVYLDQEFFFKRFKLTELILGLELKLTKP